MKYNENQILQVLKENFGFNSFRYGQFEIIDSILEGHNTLVVMPTGGGKSLCYQLPALLTEGTALIISPLIALMKDQVDSLTKINIPAAFINSSLKTDEINKRLENTINGFYKIVFIAPERLESNAFTEKLSRTSLSFLAVDEAHCISEWGHDFRPAYLNIIKVIEKISKIPVIALTATATPDVQDDIIASLKLKNAKRYIRGFDRPNLNYLTELRENKFDRLTDLCKKQTDGSVIIYCGTRKRVEMFSESLRKARVNALGYHAGMEDLPRKTIQEKFINNEIKVIVATNAFGMGIDKPDVRMVVHLDYTLTLEAYYQEAGRAGRDGKPADCILLHHPPDRGLMEFFIDSQYPPRRNIKKIYNSLYDLANAQSGEKPIRLLPLNPEEFANINKLPLTAVNSVLNLFERNNIIKKGLAGNSATIRFTTSREGLVEYFRLSEGIQKEILEILLRSVGQEAFKYETEIDLNNIIQKYHIKLDDIIKYLRRFEFARLLRFIPSGAGGGIIFTQERMPDNQIPIDFKSLDLRRKRAEAKLDAVVEYANISDCKRNYILNYFKESDIVGDCGRCSGCRTPKLPVQAENYKSDILQGILRVVSELGGRFGKKIVLDYLGGRKNKKLLFYKMNKNDSYGILKGKSESDTDMVFTRAISDGFIKYNTGLYPTIEITAKGRSHLSRETKTLKYELIEENEDANRIYIKLSELRNELSKIEGITQRAIISDKTLRQISGLAPKSKKELEKIPGTGSYFVNRWGDIFISRIIELTL